MPTRVTVLNKKENKNVIINYYLEKMIIGISK